MPEFRLIPNTGNKFIFEPRQSVENMNLFSAFGIRTPINGDEEVYFDGRPGVAVEGACQKIYPSQSVLPESWDLAHILG